MDRTDKIIIDKLSQLTDIVNTIIKNSKKIHELSDIPTDGPLYIAVSDGTNTGKTEYKPSEVSKEEFENIAKMQLSTQPDTSTLFIKDSEGNVIASTNLSFLNGNNVTLNINEEEKRLELLDFNGEVISAVALSELFPEVKQKYLFTHTLTENDIVNGDVKLDLPKNPYIRDWYDLHINTSWVKPGSYEIINNDQLVIYKTAMPYGLKTGAEVIFQYSYTDV